MSQQQQGKTIPAKFFREEIVNEDLSMSDLGLAIVSALEEQLQASVRIDCLGVIKAKTPNTKLKILKHSNYPIIGEMFDKHIKDECERETKESEIRSQSMYQRLADDYAVKHNLPKITATERPSGKSPEGTNWNSYRGEFLREDIEIVEKIYQKLIIKNKKYYKNNVEKINEREKINELRKEKVECEFCKSIIRKDGLSRHHKTKKCLATQ